MHQLAGGAEVFLVAEAVRERLFVLDGEHRDLVHRADVGVQRAERAGHRQVVGDEGLIERGSCHGRHFSSVHMRLLTKGEVPSVPFMERRGGSRSEEHTAELQSLMRISYAVFFLKKKKNKIIQ